MYRVLFALALLFPVAAAAQQQPPAEQPRTLHVTGTGTVEREPDRAVVMLAVESEGPTAREASQANATLMEAVVAAIRAAGIPARNIRTTSYQLNPVYSRPPANEGGTPRISGYRAMNMVNVTVDSLARVGPVIDAAIDAGANRVHHLSFELRDQDAARREAIERAVAVARAEAEAVAAAAGQRLGEPLTITTSTMLPPPSPRMPYAMDMVAAEARAQTPVEAGTLEVQATVNIVYKLESR
jgi:uncharacterized protein YggE